MIPLLDFNQMNIIHRFGFQNEKNYSDKEKNCRPIRLRHGKKNPRKNSERNLTGTETKISILNLITLI